MADMVGWAMVMQPASTHTLPAHHMMDKPCPHADVETIGTEKCEGGNHVCTHWYLFSIVRLMFSVSDHDTCFLSSLFIILSYSVAVFLWG